MLVAVCCHLTHGLPELTGLIVSRFQADLSQDFIGLKKHLVILINIVNFFSFQLVIQVMFTLVC